MSLIRKRPKMNRSFLSHFYPKRDDVTCDGMWGEGGASSGFSFLSKLYSITFIKLKIKLYTI